LFSPPAEWLDIGLVQIKSRNAQIQNEHLGDGWIVIHEFETLKKGHFAQSALDLERGREYRMQFVASVGKNHYETV